MQLFHLMKNKTQGKKHMFHIRSLSIKLFLYLLVLKNIFFSIWYFDCHKEPWHFLCWSDSDVSVWWRVTGPLGKRPTASVMLTPRSRKLICFPEKLENSQQSSWTSGLVRASLSCGICFSLRGPVHYLPSRSVNLLRRQLEQFSQELRSRQLSSSMKTCLFGQPVTSTLISGASRRGVHAVRRRCKQEHLL